MPLSPTTRLRRATARIIQKAIASSGAPTCRLLAQQLLCASDVVMMGFQLNAERFHIEMFHCARWGCHDAMQMMRMVRSQRCLPKGGAQVSIMNAN